MSKSEDFGYLVYDLSFRRSYMQNQFILMVNVAIAVWIIAVAQLGIFGSGEIARIALYYLAVAGGAILTGLVVRT